MNTSAQKEKKGFHGVGLFVAGANTLLLSAISWHAVVHPSVGATNEFTMQLIQRQATTWFVLHMYFALTAALFAAAGLAIIGAWTRLTANALGLVGWSILTVINVLLAILAIIEATAQGDAAVAGDLNAFALWFSISRGFEIVFILFSTAFLTTAVDEFRASVPLTPRWASGVAMVGAALVIIAVIGASGLRIVALGPLWSAAALPLIWFIWLGLRLASASGQRQTEPLARLAATGEAATQE